MKQDGIQYGKQQKIYGSNRSKGREVKLINKKKYEGKEEKGDQCKIDLILLLKNLSHQKSENTKYLLLGLYTYLLGDIPSTFFQQTVKQLEFI